MRAKAAFDNRRNTFENCRTGSFVGYVILVETLSHALITIIQASASELSICTLRSDLWVLRSELGIEATMNSQFANTHFSSEI